MSTKYQSRCQKSVDQDVNVMPIEGINQHSTVGAFNTRIRSEMKCTQSGYVHASQHQQQQQQYLIYPRNILQCRSNKNSLKHVREMKSTANKRNSLKLPF